jgi:transcriptional regulator with XRE-family HTH domain
MSTLGQRLRELRGVRSQAEFTRFLGLSSQQTYQRYESGTTAPDSETLLIIATKCAVSSDWLLGISENRGSNFSSISMTRDKGSDYGKGLEQQRSKRHLTGLLISSTAVSVKELLFLRDICLKAGQKEDADVIGDEIDRRASANGKEKVT